MRDQFVISIGGRVHIPLTARSARTTASARVVSRTARSVPGPASHSGQSRPAEIFGWGKLSTGTTVQIEPIYVVILLRVDRCPSAACQPCCGYKLYRTEPAYPPGPDRVVPPRSPPRRGGTTNQGQPCSFACGKLPSAWFRVTVGDDPPHPPAAAFGREGWVSFPGLRPQRLSVSVRPRLGPWGR
jgi:hypothetical protein